jgi:hypothetical protein
MRPNRSCRQRLLYLFVGSVAPLVVQPVSPFPTPELNAQAVQLRPHIGLYLPTRISVQNRVLQVQQRVGVTVGARLTLTFNQRFDMVTGITYLPGYAIFRGAGNRMHVGTASHLLTTSTAARYWLLPLARMLAWEVHTGLGVGFGGQPAYADLFERSTVTGILGTTVRYHIGRLVSLQLRVQDRLYRVRLGGPNPGNRQPLQISFGLGLPIVESLP